MWRVYYIDRVEIKRFKMLTDESIDKPPAFYSTELVQYLMDNKYITKSDIKYQFIASMTIKADTFREFLQIVFSNFSE